MGEAGFVVEGVHRIYQLNIHWLQQSKIRRIKPLLSCSSVLWNEFVEITVFTVFHNHEIPLLHFPTNHNWSPSKILLNIYDIRMAVETRGDLEFAICINHCIRVLKRFKNLDAHIVICLVHLGLAAVSDLFGGDVKWFSPIIPRILRLHRNFSRTSRVIACMSVVSLFWCWRAITPRPILNGFMNIRFNFLYFRGNRFTDCPHHRDADVFIRHNSMIPLARLQMKHHLHFLLHILILSIVDHC